MCSSFNPICWGSEGVERRSPLLPGVQEQPGSHWVNMLLWHSNHCRINGSMMINQWMSEFQKDEKTSQNYSIAELNMFFLQNVAIAALASWCITLRWRVKIALQIDPDCWKVLPQTLQSKWKDLHFFSRSERMAKEWFALPCYWNVCFFLQVRLSNVFNLHIFLLWTCLILPPFLPVLWCGDPPMSEGQLMHLLLGLSLNIYCTSTYVTR